MDVLEEGSYQIVLDTNPPGPELYPLDKKKSLREFLF